MNYQNNIGIGDPSQQKQDFTNIHLKVLCIRYWTLSLWDCNDMVFPYWRIYWNKNNGGVLSYGEEIHEMTPDTIYIIPPFTPYNTKYKEKHRFDNGINVFGRNVNVKDDEDNLSQKSLLHLFIHFNLGVPFDNVYPGIIKINLKNDDKNKLEQIASSLKEENVNFSLKFNFKVQSFIIEILSHLSTELWKTLNIDNRVLIIIRYIETNMNVNFNNDDLASKVNMATNSFARLFKEEMQITLHAFVNKRRIARACELFDHSDKTIEEVSYALGFSDRHHFSRVFKSVTSTTPASYRAGSSLNI